MKKLDLIKEEREWFSLKQKPFFVEIPEMNFIKIDGQGDPNTSQSFQDVVEALYAVSYHLKFHVKKELKTVDYRVMPLEGLWWADDMSEFSTEKKDEWQWTLMIRQPGFITRALFKEAVTAVEKKKNPAAIDGLRFESYTEGPSAQILHKGPFSEEKPTIDKLHDFIDENGKERTGLHHEIYMSDFRRTAPENLKTIIRQPVR